MSHFREVRNDLSVDVPTFKTRDLDGFWLKAEPNPSVDSWYDQLFTSFTKKLLLLIRKPNVVP